jgi:outer membrane autotransporter protein
MKTIALALAATTLASTPAMAGVYVNAESRDGYTGSDYTNRTVDLHVGYEGSLKKFDYYIQGGPAITAVADVDGSDTKLSGKLGGKFNVTQKLGVYGELSGISNEDADNTYKTKIGAKYSF